MTAAYATYQLQVETGGESGTATLTQLAQATITIQERGGPAWDADGGGIWLTNSLGGKCEWRSWNGASLGTAVNNTGVAVTGPCAVSPDGDLLAIGRGPSGGTAGRVVVYDISAHDGTLGTLLGDVTLSGFSGTEQINSLEWSADQAFIVVAHNSAGNGNGLAVIPWSGSGLGTPIEPSGSPGAMNVARFNPDHTLIAVGRNVASHHVGAFEFDGSTIGTYHEPATDEGSQSLDVSWSADGAYLAATFDNSPLAAVYPISGTTFGAAIDVTGYGGVGATRLIRFSPGGGFIFISGNTNAGGDEVFLYPWSGGAWGTPDSANTFAAVSTWGGAFSPDSAYVAVYSDGDRLTVFSTGIVAGGFTEILPDVFDPGSKRFITTSRGRAEGLAHALPEYGTLSCVVDDQDGDWQFANDLTGKAMRLIATYSGTDYPLWYGHLEEIGYSALTTIRPVASFRALGALSRLAASCETELYLNLRLDQAIGYILDAVGWDAAARSLDTSAKLVRYFWGSGESAIDLIQRLTLAEGPGASFSLDGEGNFVWRNATARWTATRSLNSQATISCSPTSDPLMRAPSLKPRRSEIVNSARVTTNLRVVSANVEVIWQQDGSIFLAPNTTRTVKARASDPSLNVLEPVAGTDYTVDSGSISSATINRTSGIVFDITYTAGSSGAVISGLQLRGQRAVLLAQFDAVSDVDASDSIAKYGERPWTPDLDPWPEIWWYAQQDLVNSVVTRYQVPHPTLELTVPANMSDTAMLAALGLLELDRITVNYTDIRVSGDYWVEHIEHAISPMLKHEVTLRCEQVLETDPNSTEATDSQDGNTPETSLTLQLANVLV